MGGHQDLLERVLVHAISADQFVLSLMRRLRSLCDVLLHLQIELLVVLSIR